MDYSLFTEFKKEQFLEVNAIGKNVFQENEEESVNTKYEIKGIKKVSSLDDDDVLKKYVKSRKIPEEYVDKLYSCPNFMEYTNSLLPNKFDKDHLLNDERRLLIPFYDENGELHGYQGRSLDPNSDNRYITIVLRKDIPKLYGLDKVDWNERVNVLEGPIDSMFIKNSIATCGGDLASALNGINKDADLVIIADNEPRSPNTIKKLEKAIISGYRIFIWPSNIPYKDINECILNGYTSEDLEAIIKENTYHGDMAKIKLLEWKKC